jgi:hypothetical protein
MMIKGAPIEARYHSSGEMAFTRQSDHGPRSKRRRFDSQVSLFERWPCSGPVDEPRPPRPVPLKASSL